MHSRRLHAPLEYRDDVSLLMWPAKVCNNNLYTIIITIYELELFTSVSSMLFHQDLVSATTFTLGLSQSCWNMCVVMDQS